MASPLHNLRYRIKHDAVLTQEEKDYLLAKADETNIPEIILEKNNIIVDKTKYVCKYCGIEFKPILEKHRNFIIQQFCCKEHTNAYFNKSRNKKPDKKEYVKKELQERLCACGNKFSTFMTTRIYCDTCRKIKDIEIKHKSRQKAISEGRITISPRVKKEKVIKERIPRIKKEKPILTVLEKAELNLSNLKQRLDASSDLSEVINLSKKIVKAEIKIKELKEK